MKGVSFPFFRWSQKPAALDGMSSAHDPSGNSGFASLTQPGSARQNIERRREALQALHGVVEELERIADDPALHEEVGGNLFTPESG